MNIAITIPKSISWKEYERELEQALKGSYLNFKVNKLPLNCKKGDKCYIVHDNKIRGYMLVSGFARDSFTCTTTGKKWEGNFIQRTGKFYYSQESKEMKGFRGFKYVNF